MQLQDYRFSDYRLAAYVVLGAVIAGGVAFGLDRLTAPATKIQANGAPPAAAAAAAAANNVRQIPIARTSAADLGDPENKLTPVYPAAPGKDLPVKDTPVIQAAKPATPSAAAPVAATTGSANPTAPVAAAPAVAPAAAPAPVASAAPPAANACNVEACAATFRSFRESDCSYQPFEGPRRICEGTPDANGQIALQPPVQQQTPQAQRAPINPRSVAPVARSRYDDELRDAERMVRRLPPPGAYDGVDPRGVIVMEAPERRYELRRNWISEPLD